MILCLKKIPLISAPFLLMDRMVHLSKKLVSGFYFLLEMYIALVTVTVIYLGGGTFSCTGGGLLALYLDRSCGLGKHMGLWGVNPDRYVQCKYPPHYTILSASLLVLNRSGPSCTISERG